MRQRRTQQPYALRQGRRVVYYGTTDDLDRREQEHRDEGKRFTGISSIGPKVTENTAQEREAKLLNSYRGSHRGRNPRYNETDTG